jgi:uncharacterized protein
MISKAEIKQITQTIVSSYNPDKIILFGSYASGTATHDSDLDLLIIKDTSLPGYQRSREIQRLFNPYLWPMDIIVYSNSEIEKWKNIKTSFIYEVLNNGIVLYG